MTVSAPAWVQMFGIATALASLSPLVTSLLVQWHWPAWLKQAVGFVVALLSTLPQVMSSAPQPRTAADWVSFVVAVILASQVAYRLIWKKNDLVAKLEYKTTITTPPGTHAKGK